MGDQDGWAILKRQGAAGGGGGILKRCQRILHGSDLQAGGLQQRDHLGPAGPVRPRPVYQHHIARRRGRLGVRLKVFER